MKKKILSEKKLKLEKEIIGALTSKEMNHVLGGGTIVVTRTTQGSAAVDCTGKKTTGQEPDDEGIWGPPF
jgi:hypothetical protein